MDTLKSVLTGIIGGSVVAGFTSNNIGIAVLLCIVATAGLIVVNRKNNG